MFLAGRDAVQFKDLDLHNEQGLVLSSEEIINENRQYQFDRLKKVERIKILIEIMGGGIK